ncbi:MAG TPA: VOC family protein [Anaeromyxobacteraceae bacterium]|nr:VOC family protein [Anaeromyxobacteraceae bacterium]
MKTDTRKPLCGAVLALALLAGAPARAQTPAGAPPSSASAAPARAGVDLPPITPVATGQHHPGKVVWFDLLTLDPSGAERFYGGLLGWTFVQRGDYAVIVDAGTAVAGVIRMPAAHGQMPQARWVPLISVSNLDAAVAAVKKQGGKVLEGPATLKMRGRYAAVADPRGAQFVLIDSASGDPPDADTSNIPGWLWAELWTDDPVRSSDFYKEVLGYQVRQEGSGKDLTWAYVAEGQPRARAVRTPFERVTAQWLPYVAVADLNAALARVKSLGGRVIRAPTPSSKLSVISDGGGAVMVLEERPGAPPLPPPPPVAAAATTTPADAFGIEAAQRAAEEEAAAQAAAAAQGAVPAEGMGVTAAVPVPVPYFALWLAPSPWWGWWGPGWWGPGWYGRPPPWVGSPGWGRPPGSWPPGYRPPGYRPGAPAPPRGMGAPPRGGAAAGSRGGGGGGGSHSSGGGHAAPHR